MQFIKDIVKGIIIGVANAIPGVSGGTMMVSMGIYDNIIYCITHLFSQLKKSILMLLPYFLGMAIGIVGLAFAIKFLDANFPFQTRMVFIGLILGGIPLLLKRVKGDGKSKVGVPHALVFLIFFAAIIAMEYFGGNGKDVVLTTGVISLVKIFFVGLVASATMVIPGVSGSMMMMIMGYYNPIMNAITEFVTGLTNGDWDTVIHIGIIMVPFALGIVLGIFVIAKIIEFLFSKWEALTYCAILGLVVSSPVVILMGTSLKVSILTILTGIVALAAGVVVALKLGKE